MSDATCKTCLWLGRSQYGNIPECRKNPPRYSNHPDAPDGTGYWPGVDELTGWCGEHPDRQPHLECGVTTIVSGETAPTAADMRRLLDALEKIASRAARAKS